MSFEFHSTEIEGVKEVIPEVYEDDRGYFVETYVGEEFREAGIQKEFPLEYYSKSRQNVLRGLHFQRPPHAQAKVVSCPVGEVYDLVVDLRPDSSSFGESTSLRLSEEKKNAVFLPRGCAHGFYTLRDNSFVFYQVDNQYAPEAESGIVWNDPDLDLDWPLRDDTPIVSDKDARLPQFADVKGVFS